jgi:hypothetical protein
VDDTSYGQYLEEHIYSLRDHDELLARVGPQRLATIKADERTGYAINLDRK